MYIFLACLLWGYTEAIPAPGHGALVGYCDTTAHCDAGECCVSFNQPRGKRVVLNQTDPNLARLVQGSCQKMGTDGSDCFIGSVMPATDGLFYDCPCASGYTCASTGMWALDKGTLGKCEPLHKRQVTVCTSGADCADDECCVSEVRPIGKKRAGHGHCMPMAQDGSSCLMRYPSGKPNDVVYQCPCSAGLTCHGNGLFDIPLGEVGTCGV